MSIEDDISRLNINSVLHGAFLLSLFEAHPNKNGVINSFEYYAKKIGDLAIGREISDTALSDQKEAFDAMLSILKNISHNPSQE